MPISLAPSGLMKEHLYLQLHYIGGNRNHFMSVHQVCGRETITLLCLLFCFFPDLWNKQTKINNKNGKPANQSPKKPQTQTTYSLPEAERAEKKIAVWQHKSPGTTSPRTICVVPKCGSLTFVDAHFHIWYPRTVLLPLCYSPNGCCSIISWFPCAAEIRYSLEHAVPAAAGNEVTIHGTS